MLVRRQPEFRRFSQKNCAQFSGKDVTRLNCKSMSLCSSSRVIWETASQESIGKDSNTGRRFCSATVSFRRPIWWIIVDKWPSPSTINLIYSRCAAGSHRGKISLASLTIRRSAPTSACILMIVFREFVSLRMRYQRIWGCHALSCISMPSPCNFATVLAILLRGIFAVSSGNLPDVTALIKLLSSVLRLPGIKTER